MLHIISNPNASAPCTLHLLEDDAVILIGDGVYAITGNNLNNLDVPVPVYALEADLAARGISPTSGETPANMSRFVALVVEHASSVTWT
ncbi:uncharacterized protein METZ01_LOCUS206182 [marine metagenome]|uniref:Uncharacterized protein n=1 Tax=marine metagenome TaxID=408172 RepID=A0A382ERM7_9ZZZZ